MTKRRRKADAPRRFEARAGRTYAIDPRAFFDFFMEPETRDNERVGNVEVVDIEGPLEQYASGWCDSYEAIAGRITQACESDAAAIVMRIDSPGGACAGCFDTARAVRSACLKAGKPLYAYVVDKACSAGYAFAAAAQSIALGDTATVGSIGVISTREDVSAMLAQRGVRVELITSGARKRDGHPESPITDDEIAATQLVVDSVANVFFALIEETRGLSAAKVAALQAGVFHGESAISARLADSVQSFDSFLAAIAGGNTTMATAYEKARASLQEAAEGDDANAAAAKRALAAMDEGNEPDKKDDDKSDDADKAEGDDAGKAEGDDDDKKAEGDDEPVDDAPSKKKEAEARMSGELSAIAEVHKLRSELAAKDVASERKALIASRKDFDGAMIKELSKSSTPIEIVRNLVKTLPKGPAVKPPSPKGGGTAAVAGVRGETQGGVDASSSEAEDLDRAMGLSANTFGTRREGNQLVLGVMSKTNAAASGNAGGVK
jgi:ClpP class serine protease